MSPGRSFPHFSETRGHLMCSRRAATHTAARFIRHSASKAGVVNLTQACREWPGAGIQGQLRQPGAAPTPRRIKAFGNEAPDRFSIPTASRAKGARDPDRGRPRHHL